MSLGCWCRSPPTQVRLLGMELPRRKPSEQGARADVPAGSPAAAPAVWGAGAPGTSLLNEGSLSCFRWFPSVLCHPPLRALLVAGAARKHVAFPDRRTNGTQMPPTSPTSRSLLPGPDPILGRLQKMTHLPPLQVLPVCGSCRVLNVVCPCRVVGVDEGWRGHLWVTSAAGRARMTPCDLGGASSSGFFIKVGFCLDTFILPGLACPGGSVGP